MVLMAMLSDFAGTEATQTQLFKKLTEPIDFANYNVLLPRTTLVPPIQTQLYQRQHQRQLDIGLISPFGLREARPK
jgi:hypothetical protein